MSTTLHLSQQLPALSLFWYSSLQETGKSNILETGHTGGEVPKSSSVSYLVYFFKKGRRAEGRA